MSEVNSIEEIKKKINDQNNVLRLEQNTINLLMEARFPGQYCEVLTEVLKYHQGFSTQVKNQMATLQALLPVPEAKVEEPKVIEPVVVQ